MSGYVLTWNPSDEQAGRLLDGSLLQPQVLGAMSINDVRNFELPIGRTTRKLHEIFSVTGEPGSSLTLRQTPPLNLLGAGMKSGQLRIEGDAGDHLGASMSSGSIHVQGRAGHHVGGPLPGFQRGMTGGEIFVQSDAGDLVGLRMRRGLIAVAGHVGRSPGYRMLAGTIVLTRGPLDFPGLELRRGSIICLDRQHPFTGNRAWKSQGQFSSSSIATLGLLLQHVRTQGFASHVPVESLHGNFELWAGDTLELSRGEIWQWRS